MTEEEACEIILRYESRHGLAPQPYGFLVEDIAAVLQEHMAKGLPVDFDWWADLPPGADAEPQIECKYGPDPELEK